MTEAKNINDQFEKNLFTPNTYRNKQDDLEKWVKKEEREI